MGKREIEKNSIKRNNIIITIIKSILIIVLIAAIAYLLLDFYNAYKNRNLYDNLDNDITLNNDTTTEEITKVDNGFVDKVKELQQDNSDVKGWIKIDGTNINYPLLQGTDDDYYTKHNYKKETSKYGSIMINYKSNLNDVNSNVIIYGHNIINSTQMFADLIKYEKKDFYTQHPTVKIMTDEGESDYQIMYVFKSRVFYVDETNVFRYYQYYDFNDKSTYNEYLNNCKKIELYNTEVTAKYGEQLITLSTCEYSQDNGRLVVVAKKIEP